MCEECRGVRTVRGVREWEEVTRGGWEEVVDEGIPVKKG